MSQLDPGTIALHALDCSTRMFLVSLCLTDEDLRALGFLPRQKACSDARHTAARAALHRIVVDEPALARAVSDRLDLRHVETVLAVRASEPEALSERCADAGGRVSGDELAGWAWALLTDGRPVVFAQGRRLMTECIVRGLRLLAHSNPPPPIEQP